MDDLRSIKGWKALGYESFKEYGEKELGYQENYIHKLVNAAEISLQIGFDPDCTIVQPPESQLRPLKSIPEDERKAIWDEANAGIIDRGFPGHGEGVSGLSKQGCSESAG